MIALGLAEASSARAQDQAADTPAPTSPTPDAAATDTTEENAFASAVYEVGQADVRVTLTALREVGAPRVRTESGFVRVWFEDMTGWTTLDLEGDGGAIRFVRARQGAGDSSVVILRVGDHRRVPESAVHVEHTGTRVTIAIPRQELPTPRMAQAPAVAVAAPAPSDAIAEPSDGATPTAIAAPPTPEGESRSAADALRHQASLTSSPALSSLGLPSEEHGSNVWTLLAITALLLIALGGVRLWQARRVSKGLEPSIRIIAATRLSPKQQLVVVRALGQDHLLAIEPGRTERLISITTPAEGAKDDEPLLELRLSRDPGAPQGPISLPAALAPPPLPSISTPAAHAPTLLGRTLAALGLGARHTPATGTPMNSLPLGSMPPIAHPPSAAPGQGTPFSRELARLVEARAETPLPSAPLASSLPAGGAVAGLVRLRAQAGGRG
ncbi:MAG: flagellar biosynthetic protein FliO [Sandaracinus sp.]